jgi:GST-like protein
MESIFPGRASLRRDLGQIVAAFWRRFRTGVKQMGMPRSHFERPADAAPRALSCNFAGVGLNEREPERGLFPEKERSMIDLYTWATPNGRKASIMLEEIGLPYKVHPVNLGRQEQFAPAFLEIAPNNKIPAIVDHDAPGRLSVFESGAILVYLAEKSGKLLASRGAERYKALEWLNWQMGGIGPMFGQLGFFAIRSTEKSALAIERFTEESRRLLAVIDRRLQQSAYLAGDNYSIADVAAYPWMLAGKTFLGPVLGPDVEAMPSVNRWLTTVGEREAVKRGMAVPKV